MVWAEDKQRGLCSWQPPRDGDYNTHRWALKVRVEDGRGGFDDSSFNPTMDYKVVLARRGKIAFDKWDTDGAYDSQEAVFVMNVDGMAPTRITNLHNVNENQPDLSPSGDWVAFCSTQEGDWRGSDIWIATTDGTTRYNLTQTPNQRESYPRWSPDGSMIAFYSAEAGSLDRCSVRIVEPHRPSGAPGTPNPGKKVSDNCYSSWASCPPSWDPTSRYLAFLDDDATTEGYASSLIITDTTKPEYSPPWPNPGYGWYKRIDGTYFDTYTMAWSPKGDHIALSGLNRFDDDPSVAPDLPIPGTREDNDERIYVVTVDPDNPINGNKKLNAFPRYLGEDGIKDDPPGSVTGPNADDPSLVPDQYPKPLEGWTPADMDDVCWSENGYPPFTWSPGGMYLCCSTDRNADWVYEVHRFHRQDGNPPKYGDRVQLTQSAINTVQPAYTAEGSFLVLQAYNDNSPDWRNRLYRVRPRMADSAYPTTELQLLNEITVDVSTHSVSR